MVDKVLFSSDMGEWDTPPDVVADLGTVFKWDWDVCSSGPNVCPRYYDKQTDGLMQYWRGMCWLNPPYGRSIGKWTKRAMMMGADPLTTVVCLLPARTDTIWWHSCVRSASLVVFIKGRLTFGSDAYWEWRWATYMIKEKPNSLYGKKGKKNSAPFPSAFIVFGALWTQEQEQKLHSYGWPVWEAW